MGKKSKYEFNRVDRRDGTRNRNQGKPHARDRKARPSIARLCAERGQDSDTETRKVIQDILRWDMNAVGSWVRAQEGAFPKGPCRGCQNGIAEGLTLVKTLLIDLELSLSRLKRKSKRRN